MGRHSIGSNNLTIAPGVYIFLALLVGISLATCTWVRTINRTNTTAADECIRGDLTLLVASTAGEKDTATKLIDAYNATKPKVRDYCVTAALTDNMGEAGAYISAESDGGVVASLAKANRSAAGDSWPVAAALKVGLSATEEVNKDNLGDVSYPVADNAMASALVASSINNNTAEKVTDILTTSKALTIDSAVKKKQTKIVTHEQQVPTDYSFTEISGLTQPVRVVPLNASETVNEEAVRAGADFSTASMNEEAAKSTTTKTALTAIAALGEFDSAENPPASTNTPTTSDAQSPTGVNNSPVDTLYLLDTSDAMGSDAGTGKTWFSATSNAIAEVAPKVGETGHTVAIWNYSSPLNPGVTQGWRRNVNFDANDSGWAVASKAIGFSTGGKRHTRSALVAALKYCADYAKSTSKPVRIVLITTGNDDDLEESTVVKEITAAKDAGVELDIIHVGSGAQDKPIMDAAAETTVATDVSTIPEAIETASGM